MRAEILHVASVMDGGWGGERSDSLGVNSVGLASPLSSSAELRSISANVWNGRTSDRDRAERGHVFERNW